MQHSRRIEILLRTLVCIRRAEIASRFGDMQAPEFFGIKDSEGCWKAFFNYLEEGVKGVELYEGAREVLQNARRNGKVAIVSTQKGSILHDSLARHGVENLIDVVITGDDVTRHKPHPESLEKALAHFNAKADQAVMFGDSGKDVRAAHSAGAHSVLMYPESHSVFYDFKTLKSHKLTHVAKGMHEVVNWF